MKTLQLVFIHLENYRNSHMDTWHSYKSTRCKNVMLKYRCVNVLVLLKIVFCWFCLLYKCSVFTMCINLRWYACSINTKSKRTLHILGRFLSILCDGTLVDGWWNNDMGPPLFGIVLTVITVLDTAAFCHL